MKPTLRKCLLGLSLLILPVALVACTGSSSSGDTETTSQPLSAEERQRLEDTTFLSSFSGRTYELTGTTTPGFVGRWFEKEINEVPHTVTVTDGV